MNLKQLAAETLVEKHRRIKQDKCRHPEIYSTSVTGPDGIWTNAFCLECGKKLSEPKMNQEDVNDMIARGNAAMGRVEREFAWLVEIPTDTGPEYYQLEYDNDWTRNANDALRFARKIDALRFIQHEGWTQAQAVEHIWE